MSDTNDWQWLKDTYWYVPEDNLKAIQFNPNSGEIRTISDQTVYHIENFEDGYFWGKTVVQLTVDNKALPVQCLKLIGSVTPEGSVLLSFIPAGDDASQATTGSGIMRFYEDQWMMENQMATGQRSLTAHWAYMVQCQPGQSCNEKLPGTGYSLQEFLSQCDS